jgi:hypothetical protein
MRSKVLEVFRTVFIESWTRHTLLFCLIKTDHHTAVHELQKKNRHVLQTYQGISNRAYLSKKALAGRCTYQYFTPDTIVETSKWSSFILSARWDILIYGIWIINFHFNSRVNWTLFCWNTMYNIQNVARFNEQFNNNKYNPFVLPDVKLDGMISNTKLEENTQFDIF